MKRLLGETLKLCSPSKRFVKGRRGGRTLGSKGRDKGHRRMPKDSWRFCLSSITCDATYRNVPSIRKEGVTIHASNIDIREGLRVKVGNVRETDVFLKSRKRV